MRRVVHANAWPSAAGDGGCEHGRQAENGPTVRFHTYANAKIRDHHTDDRSFARETVTSSSATGRARMSDVVRMTPSAKS